MLTRGIGALFGALLAAWTAAAVWLLWPRWPAVPRAGDVIVSPDWYVRRALVLALAVILAALLAFLLVTALRQGSRRWTRVVTLVAGQLAIVGLPFPVLVLVLSLAFAFASPVWDVLGGRRVEGTTYVLLRRRDDSRRAMAAELPRLRLFRRTRVLAVSADAEYGSVAVVRPAGRAEYALGLAPPDGGAGYGRLVLSPSRRQLVFVFPYLKPRGIVDGEAPRVACLTDAVYDLRARTLTTGPGLRTLSPFLLVTPSDELEESDARALVMASYVHGWRWAQDVTVSAAALTGDLQSLNPQVRALAAEALGHYRSEPAVEPALRKALRDPEGHVRKAAQQALDALRDAEAF